MSIYDDLEQSIYRAIQPALPEGFTCIFPYQNAPQPKYPYLTIDVLGVDSIGREYSSTLVSPYYEYGYGFGYGIDYGGGDYLGVTSYLVQDYEARVRFYFLGKNDDSRSLVEVAHEFEFSLNRQVVWEELQRNNLGIIRKTSLVRAPKKQDTQWIMCYQMDVFFSYAVEDRQDMISYISEVNINGVATEPNGDFINCTINISEND